MTCPIGCPPSSSRRTAASYYSQVNSHLFFVKMHLPAESHPALRWVSRKLREAQDPAVLIETEGSQTYRASVRLDGVGQYVNPFTGEKGGKKVGAHIPLDQEWFR